MDIADFISKVHKTHQEYTDTIAKLKEGELVQYNTCGEWSVKDVIAHITWYEKEMVGVLKTHILSGSNLWNLPLEERNAAIHKEFLQHPLEEVLTKSEQIHAELMELIQNLPEDDLHNAGNFKDMPDDWIPWQVIASNTFEHYPDHTKLIKEAFPHIIR